MYRTILLLICFFTSQFATAQSPDKANIPPCGTPNGISPWLRTYKANPDPSLAQRSADTLWVALKLHMLATDNGTGRFAFDRALDAFCRLNADFGPSNIQFYLKDDINLINNTEWYAHNDIPQGIDMMFSNNVDDAFNCYFVGDPAGNCGYNLPYAGVAIKHSCASPTDHTWAHEAGHALALPHPFIGWEGKTYSYNVPTPTYVTYDYTYFHDTLDTQIPAPLDTALVEYLDGSNCAIAADLICDTKPDYLSYRWNCNSQGLSSVKQKDPSGADFYSDGSLYMSYADDACQNRFSPEEIDIMRANLMTEKVAWIAPTTAQPSVAGLSNTIEPIQDMPVPASGPNLRWSAVPNATYYLVQASRFSSFALREVDIITTDTSVITAPLQVNKTYYWRVKAFNNWNACTSFSTSASFTTVAATATYQADADGWRCYPSLLSGGAPLYLEIPDVWRGQEAKAQIFDVSGRQVWASDIDLNNLQMSLFLNSESWESGMYYFVLSSAKGIKRQSLLFTR